MTTIRVAHAGDGAAIGGELVRSWQAAYRGIFPDALLDALDPVERGGWWSDASRHWTRRRPGC